MKSVLSVLLWLTLFVGALAYSISEGSFSVNGAELFVIDDLSFDEVHRYTINSQKDVITIDLTLNGDIESRPHQLMYILTNNDGLDFPLFPTFTAATKEAKLKLAVSKIPNALKAEERLFLNLIIADDNKDEANLYTEIVELLPSEDFKANVGYKKADRLGALPEIHHIFREDPKTVNAIIPLIFSAAAGVLLLVLLVAWASVVDGSLFTSPQGSTFKTAFLVTVAALEYTFAKYYLGASIFTTISYVALIAGPYLFFGSKALTELAKQRGKA